MIIQQSRVLLEENSKVQNSKEKKEKLYYEYNDIQFLLGVETYAETTTLILERFELGQSTVNRCQSVHKKF